MYAIFTLQLKLMLIEYIKLDVLNKDKSNGRR